MFGPTYKFSPPEKNVNQVPAKQRFALAARHAELAPGRVSAGPIKEFFFESFKIS